MSRAILAAVTVWVCACSSNGAPSDLSSTAKARLADYCGKRDACQAELGLTDVEPCPTSMCLAGEAEEPALLEFFDCQLAKPCPMFFNDDECVAAAGTSDAERDAFVARCTAKAGECSMVDIGEACPIVGMPILRIKFVRAFDACLGLACGEIQACWDAAGMMACW